jgi:hypothetical protein
MGSPHSLGPGFGQEESAETGRRFVPHGMVLFSMFKQDVKIGIPSGNQTWQWEIPQFNDFFQRETSI